MDDTVDALQGKLAWQFLQQKSLWARFLHSQMRGYDIHGDPPPTAIPMTVQEAFQNIEMVQQLVTTEQWDKIHLIQLQPEEKDELVFIHTPNGKFSTRKYWDLRRVHGTGQSWTSTIWNKYTPVRINTFMWRLYLNALRLDSNIKTRGIQFVSRCACCENHREESSLHLFFKSEVKWLKRFGKTLLYFFLKKSYLALSGLQLLQVWLHGFSRRSQLGICIIGIFFYTLYELWKGRSMFLRGKK